MAFTPLYKRLKTQGTTVYAFPGAAEDFNQQLRNDNFKKRFSKFVLLNLPKSDKWDFEAEFYTESSEDFNSDFSESVIGSLRNYVANQETTIKNTRTNANEFFYDNSVLTTPTEKILFKWLKKAKLIEFEPATPNVDYFTDSNGFEPNSNDPDFLPERLWKERSTNDMIVSDITLGGTSGTNLTFLYGGVINYKVNDKVTLSSGEVSILDTQNNPLILSSGFELTIIEIDGGLVTFDLELNTVSDFNNVSTKLVYNRLIKYIGEISSDSNISLQSQFYQQIYANMIDNQGQTPDILFRTTFDDNYAPDLRYPLLPTQFQAEIIGAEDFSSPIVSRPQDYPLDFYAIYDNDDNLNQFNYINKTGDVLRRSGEYFGTTGDINNIDFTPSTIDGITIDFNTDHYVRMNIPGNELRNFDEFNSLYVNNVPPKDFEFNAVLWYYDVEDVDGNTSTNLYGISFLDNPEIDPNFQGERFPVFRKYVNNGSQDGTSFALALNLDTMLSSDNPVVNYNPNNIGNLFGMNLYNEAMRSLAQTTDSFTQALSKFSSLQTDVSNLKQLIYTQTDIISIRNQISDLNNLLRLYSTNQIVSTDTIEVENDFSVSPPEIKLNSIEGRYNVIENILTSDLYTQNGVSNTRVRVPNGKDFLINIENNDISSLILNNNLNIILDRDLDFKQTVDIIIDSDREATENKLLDVKIAFTDSNNISQITNLVENNNMPIYFNSILNQENNSIKMKQIYNNVSSIELTPNQTLIFGVDTTRGLKRGDCILLNNIVMQDDVVLDTQVIIDEVISHNEFSILYVDYSILDEYITDEISNGNLNIGDYLGYNSVGYISFNKGKKISITRIDDTLTSTIEERYKIIEILL